MSEETENDIQELEPEITPTRRFSLVWIVPLLAVVLGAWLVYRHIQDQGVLIEVGFDTADGIMAGKTEVRSRSVKVGQVEDVRLSEDLKSVRVSVRMDPKAAVLARAESRFWVVRPRVSGASVSGLGTIISGAYIELDPGPEGEVRRSFDGLEEPPVTPSDVPGLRLNLFAEESGQIGVGAPVYFEGSEVGKVERRRFSPETRDVELRIFISEQYKNLVTKNVLFWNDSGVEVTAGAAGFQLKLPSLEALVAGGVTFGVPEGMEPGDPVADGDLFMLFGSQQDAQESVFFPLEGGEFLLFFDQSVRGLSKGAPVEFRGLEVGRVAKISFEYATEEDSRRVPVLVELDRSQIDAQFPILMRNEGAEGLKNAIASGLRGTLRQSSLITGQLFVDLDFHEGKESGPVAEASGYPVMPTVETGLARLEEQLAAVLLKLEQLPLEDSLAKINEAVQGTTRTLEAARGAFERSEGALAEAKDTLNAIRVVLEDPEFSKLPGEVRTTLATLREAMEGVGPNSSAYGDIRRTLDELRGAARSIERVADTIDEKPNALLFGKGRNGKAIPRAVPTR